MAAITMNDLFQNPQNPPLAILAILLINKDCKSGCPHYEWGGSKTSLPPTVWSHTETIYISTSLPASSCSILDCLIPHYHQIHVNTIIGVLLDIQIQIKSFNRCFNVYRPNVSMLLLFFPNFLLPSTTINMLLSAFKERRKSK